MTTRADIHDLVHAFYADVRADAQLGPVFARTLPADWQPHLERMVEFWCTVLLGTRSFKGNVYARHMALPGLEPAHFKRWLALWRQHTRRRLEAGHAHELWHTASGIARNLQLGYFGAWPEETA